MAKRIVLSPEFLYELEELLEVLVEKQYFSSLSWALEYIDSIEKFIEQSLGTYPAKDMPCALEKFGSYYIKYNHSKHTTWYIVFDETDDMFYVRHITNNHVSGQYFNF